MPRTAVPFENVGEMLEQLGGIDPRRVRSWPPPGRATEKDVVTLHDRENRLYELVDGVLVEKVMGYTEAALAADLIGWLSPFVRQHDLGIVAGADGTVRLMPRLVRIPDVSFTAWAKLPGKEYPAEPVPDLVPDLVAEVLSEGNTRGEMQRKLKEYFLAGVRLVWLIDPGRRTVTAHTAPDRAVTLAEGQALEGGEVLPGFALPLADLFARVPRGRPQGRGPGGTKARRKPRG